MAQTYVLKKGQIEVRLDRAKIGVIRKVPGGFQYWPQGLKRFSDPFDVRATVDEVKSLIE